MSVLDVSVSVMNVSAVDAFPDFDVNTFLSDRSICMLSGCSRVHSLPRAQHRAKLRRKYNIVYQLRVAGDIPSVVDSISKLPQHFERLWTIVCDEFARYSLGTRDALIYFFWSPACRSFRTISHDPRECSPGVNYSWKQGKWTWTMSTQSAIMARQEWWPL